MESDVKHKIRRRSRQEQRTRDTRDTKILFSRDEARARSRCMPRARVGGGCGGRTNCHTTDEDDKGLQVKCKVKRMNEQGDI